MSPRVILSAYHCAVNPNSVTADVCDHSDERRVAVLGEHKILLHKLASYITIPIIKVLYPPGAWLYEQDNDSHDFALFLLKHPAKYSRKVSPICLPDPTAEFGGVKAMAAGWGRTDKPSVNTKESPVLQSVRLTVSKMQYDHKKMFGTKLVKEDDKYQDPCTGDSGEFLINSFFAQVLPRTLRNIGVGWCDSATFVSKWHLDSSQILY